MRIIIDTDDEGTLKGDPPDLYFSVNVTKMGHKAHVIHEAEGLPPKRDIRQILSAVLYGY